MGIDSGRLYPVNSNESFSNAQKLAGMDMTTGGYYAAPICCWPTCRAVWI